MMMKQKKNHKFRKIIFLSIPLLLFSCTTASKKNDYSTSIEMMLCKESNLWYVYSLDTVRNIYYPLWNCYTFHENNQYEDRWETFHCHSTSEGRTYSYGSTPGEWYYYPHINVLQLSEHNIMRLLELKNDTIVFRSTFFGDGTNDVFLFINVGEDFAHETPPKVKYSLPEDFLQ